MCVYVVFPDTDIVICIQYAYEVKDSGSDCGVGEASSNPRPTNILGKSVYPSLLPTPVLRKITGRSIDLKSNRSRRSTTPKSKIDLSNGRPLKQIPVSHPGQMKSVEVQLNKKAVKGRINAKVNGYLPQL